jgi:hypothetical protein
MNKNKRLAGFIIILCFLFAIPVLADEDAEVRVDAARLLSRAHSLVESGTCKRVKLSLKLLNGYQELKEAYPSAGIEDRSKAVKEVQKILATYCTGLNPLGPIIIAGGGGVKCGACMPTQDERMVGLLTSPVPSSQSCADCGKLDALSLALIYIKPEERGKFLEKLSPEVREALSLKLTRLDVPVVNISRSLEAELNRKVTIMTAPEIQNTTPGKITVSPDLQPGQINPAVKPNQTVPKINEQLQEEKVNTTVKQP